MAQLYDIRRRMRSDEGLTMIEIVVSAVVFFIVLTGILGLIGTTTMMGARSKQRTVMVNALNAYVERVQALPFDKVDLVGTASGVLSAEETQTVGEFRISIRPTVSIPTTLTPSGDPSLKRLSVQMTVTRGNTDQVMRYSTQVLIRDKSQYLTQAVASDATDPKIKFTTITPAEATVVWGSSHSGGALNVGVDVVASDGRLIDQVSLWSDDQYILEDSLGNRGAWPNIGVQTWSSPSFVWNTLQTQPVLQPDGSYLNQSVIFDGMRTLSAYVIDSSGISKYTVRHLLVDNVVPSTPETPSVLPQTGTTSLISWPEAADGTLPAAKYRVYVWRQVPPVLSTDSPDANWQGVTPWPYPLCTTLSYAFTNPTGVKFARFATMLYAEGVAPNNRVSSWSPIGTPWCSRPSVEGTYTVTKSGATYTTKTDLKTTSPSFPTTGTVSYNWYRVNADNSVTSLGTTTANTKQDTLNGPANNVAASVRYYATVTFTPVGYGAARQLAGATNLTMQTNTSAVTGGTVGVFPLGAGTW